MPELSPNEWNEFFKRHPTAHILQSAEWGELKAGFGWKPMRVVCEDCGAQVLFRNLPLGYQLAYIPKGPIGNKKQALWAEIDALCRRNRVVFLKVEPDAWEDDEPDLSADGFRPSRHSIQPRRTITLDIRASEDDLLAAMKQKTRYNIRLAQKKDVIVKASDDVVTFSQMMDTTGQRDDFGVHSASYYQRAYELFQPKGACELLIASYQGQPLAGLMVFACGQRAWYFYGASSNQQRNRMPTYLLQWEAIRWAKSRGCTSYDLWGVPDEDETTLEDTFIERNDGLWGVYRFKRGFGGQLKRAVQAWDKVYKSLIYSGYLFTVKR